MTWSTRTEEEIAAQEQEAAALGEGEAMEAEPHEGVAEEAGASIPSRYEVTCMSIGVTIMLITC